MVTDVIAGMLIGDGADPKMSAVLLGVGMLSNMGIVLMATPAGTIEFVERVVYALDVFACLLDVMIIDAVSAIDIGILADENIDDLVAVMTPVELTWPAP